MLSISPVNNVYKIHASNPGSGWRGWYAMARSIEEIHLAIDHYHAHGPRKIEHTNDAIPECPLCRKGMMSKPGKKR